MNTNTFCTQVFPTSKFWKFNEVRGWRSDITLVTILITTVHNWVLYVDATTVCGCSNFKLFFNFLVLNYGIGLLNTEFKLHLFYFLWNHQVKISVYSYLLSISVFSPSHCLLSCWIWILLSYSVINLGEHNSSYKRIPKWSWERQFINMNG